MAFREMDPANLKANMPMENGPSEDVFPIQKVLEMGDVPLPCLSNLLKHKILHD